MNERAETILPVIIEIAVIFEALMAKGILDYADVQEAVARCREQLPKEAKYAAYLNLIEQKYQPGVYQRIPPQPRDPQP